ncbi:hypothetical protein BSKO_04665 [Bryopsis sp. KO-2023]|nr:hypothetical protein BSKO_04665 [Bryopsis sp. KO-2023]
MGLRRSLKKLEKTVIRPLDPTAHARRKAREAEAQAQAQQQQYAHELAAAQAALAAQVEAEKEKARERERERRRRLREEYPCPPFLRYDGVETFAVVGASGVGKSSLINALLGQYVAETGCFETTELPPKMFQAKLKGASVQVADMAGGDTDKYKSEAYFRESGMRHFASVVVVAAGKPVELTLNTVRHLEKNDVPVTLVVNKMDDVVNGVFVTEGKSEEDAFAETITSYKEALKEVESQCPIFPISAVDVFDAKRGHSSNLDDCSLPEQDSNSINRYWNSFCGRLEETAKAMARVRQEIKEDNVAGYRKYLIERREKYPRPPYLPDDGVPTIGIMGKSGTGKSTFLNTILGERVAGSDVGGSSMDPGIYQWEDVRLVDLPGGCTTNAEDCLRCGIDYFDTLICLTGETCNINTVIQRLPQSNIPILMVLSKADAVIGEQQIVQRNLTTEEVMVEWRGKYSKYNLPSYCISAVEVQEECGSLQAAGSRKTALNRPINKDWIPLLQAMKREAISWRKLVG